MVKADVTWNRWLDTFFASPSCIWLPFREPSRRTATSDPKPSRRRPAQSRVDITPELAVSGYTFADTLRTDWIEPQPDHWMSRICRLAARFRVTLFLSHPERDPRSQQLYNAVFAIGSDGRLVGVIGRSTPCASDQKPGPHPALKQPAFRLAPFGGVGLLSVRTLIPQGFKRV